jgi:hypothetical protein
MRKVELLQREGDFAGTVHHPPWLSITPCLTTSGRVSDGRAHQGANHKARAAEGNHVGVRVPPATEGPPGQTPHVVWCQAAGVWVWCDQAVASS